MTSGSRFRWPCSVRLAYGELWALRMPAGSRQRVQQAQPATAGNSEPDCTQEAFSRRLLLAGTVAVPVALLSRPGVALASARLKSVAWDVPCLLSVENATPYWVKAYWINYDGDAELWKVLEPGCKWAVDTYSSHPWRFTDADTGEVLQELVISGQRPESVVLRPAVATALPQQEAMPASTPTDDAAAAAADPVAEVAEGAPRDAAAQLPGDEQFEGWDGIGGTPEDYVPAQVAGVAVTLAGGRARLLAVGFPGPLDLYFDSTDAMNVLLAYHTETRRPLTALTWSHTLQAAGVEVQRVLITRVVGDTFYCRIVLQLPGGSLRSVDSRPSDGLALALQCRCPIVVAKSISRLPSVDLPATDIGPEEGWPLPSDDLDDLEGAGDKRGPMPAGPKEAYPFLKSAINV